MKKEIHPKYYSNLQVQCNNCKAVFVIGSTVEKLSVNLCSKCHPAWHQEDSSYSVDVSGRITKFEQRKAKMAKAMAENQTNLNVEGDKSEIK